MTERMNQQFLAILIVCAVLSSSGAGESPCYMPADIAFLLDSSSSIHGDDFATEKKFMKALIGQFEIGPWRTRVSVLQYAERAAVDFYLDQFDTATDINHRIDKIQQSISDQTNTHLALEAARTKLLSPEHGARSYVPRVCVLLTRGEPANPSIALEEAWLAKEDGIIMVTIGVGKVNPWELEELVSVLASETFFHAETFTELIDAKFLQAVGEQICKAIPTTPPPDPSSSSVTYLSDVVTSPVTSSMATYPTSAPLLTTTPEKPKDSPEANCQGKAADVVFVLDMSSSIWAVHFRQQLEFVTTVIDTFDLDTDKTRVGVVVYSDTASVVFDVNTFHTKDDIADAVLAIQSEGGVTNTHKALKLVVDRMFTPEHGSRPGVAHICILITDGRSRVPAMTQKLAKKIHSEGIYLFAIGVGTLTDRKELAGLASSPTEQFMFEVNGFDALPQIRNIVASKTCEVPQADQPRCSPSKKTDVVFGLYNIGGNHRDHVTEFIKRVSAGLDLASGNVRIAINESSGNANFDLSTFTDPARLQDAITESMTTTAVSDLLYSMRRLIRGSSLKKSEVDRIVVLFISGKIKDMRKAYTESMRLKFFATLVVVGIGDGVDTDQLVTLATHRNKYDPDISHVMPVRDMSEFPLVVKKLLVLMCKTDTTIQ